MGIPASTSRTGFTTFRTLSGAYSLRKMALSSPRGSATTIDRMAIISVALTRASTPKCLEANRGVHRVPVMNSIKETSPKNGRALNTRMATMPTVVRTDIMVHRTMMTVMIRSGRTLRQPALSALPL